MEQHPDMVVEMLKDEYSDFYDVRVMDTCERILIGVRYDEILIQEVIDKKYHKFFVRKFRFNKVGFKEVYPEITHLVRDLYVLEREIMDIEEEQVVLEKRLAEKKAKYLEMSKLA